MRCKVPVVFGGFRRDVRRWRYALASLSIFFATHAAQAAGDDALVCFQMTDPIAVHATIVTADTDLVVQPPCAIDAAATQLCVPAGARRGSGASESSTAEPAARLCYRVVCPGDDGASPTARRTDTGETLLLGATSTICVPAALDQETPTGAAGSGSDGASTMEPDADDAGDGASTVAPDASSSADGTPSPGASADAGAPPPQNTFGRSDGCGDPSGEGSITASDALAALRTAVGVGSGCGGCACDVNDSGSVTATDALTILKAAVGQPVTLTCPDGPFTVTWDGGGDGTSWLDRLNWDGDAVPHFCDAVVINAPDGAKPVFSQSAASIFSLSGSQGLSVTGGSLTLRNDSTIGSLDFVSGLVAVDAALEVGDLHWSGGSLDGTGTITSTGTLTIDGAGKNFDGPTLVNAGTASWPASTIFARNGTILRNLSGHTLDIAGDVSFSFAGGSTPTFDNQGTLLRSAGAGTTLFQGNFLNSGTVDVRSGVVSSSQTYTQTSSGKLVCAVAGVDPTSIGRFQAASANLDGALQLDITGGYVPMAGDTFTPVAYASRSGTFSTITSQGLPAGLVLAETYGANDLSFQVDAQ